MDLRCPGVRAPRAAHRTLLEAICPHPPVTSDVATDLLWPRKRERGRCKPVLLSHRAGPRPQSRASGLKLGNHQRGGCRKGSGEGPALALVPLGSAELHTGSRRETACACVCARV